MNNNNKLTTPLSFYIGSDEQTEEAVTERLRLALCPTQTENCFCTSCQHVSDRQHESVTWVSPTKEYVIADLDILFSHIRFKLEPGASHFFVIRRAELLSTACANKLLKLFEEPPAGYYFYLLTSSYQRLLPTIRSRGTILFQQKHDPLTSSPLLPFFFFPALNTPDPTQFEKLLKEEQVKPSDATLLVEQIYYRLCEAYTAHPTPELEQLRDYTQTHLATPPLPGGGPLYLKSLYLAFVHLTH